MGVLQLLWFGSLTLAGLSLVMLTGLLARRTFLARTVRARARGRQRLRRTLRCYLAGEMTLREAARAAPPLAAIEELLSMPTAGAKPAQALCEAYGVHTVRRAVQAQGRRGRLMALHLLSRCGGRPARAVLRRALVRDPDPDIRLAAAKGLAELNALPALTRTLRLVRVGDARSSRVLRTIMRRVSASRTTEVIDILHASRDPGVRLICVDAVGHLRGAQVVDELVRAVGDPDLEVRAAALRGLGRLGAHGAFAAVLRGLDDPTWQVRCQACGCAGRLGLRSAVDRLVELLEDPEWWVSFRAAEALYLIDGEGRQRLHEASRRGDGAGRVAQTVLVERKAA